jgi:hypothetical protein
MISALLLLVAAASAPTNLEPAHLSGRFTLQRLPRGSGATVLAVDPQRPARLYAGGSGIFRSDDYGSTWATLDTGLRPVSLAVDPSDGRRLYALSDGDFWVSEDEGRSWNRIDEPPGFSGTFLVDAAGVVYAGGSEGVFKSFDGGRDWQATGPGVSANAVLAATDPSQAGVLYAVGPANAAFGNSVYETFDGAMSWTGPILTTDLKEQVTAIAVGAAPRRTVFVASHSAKAGFTIDIVWKSEDQGATWQAFDASIPIAADPARPSVLYATGAGVCEVVSPKRCLLVGPAGLGARSLAVAPDGRALYLIDSEGEIGAIQLDLPMHLPRVVIAR